MGIWLAVCLVARAGCGYQFATVTTDDQTLRKVDPMVPQAEEPPSDVSVIATLLPPAREVLHYRRGGGVTTSAGADIHKWSTSAPRPEARHSASVDESRE